MKVNYFGYYFYNKKTDEKILFNIGPFLRAFCDFENIGFKHRFDHGGEHLYLFRSTDNLFMFVMTRSGEIIKSIDRKNLSVKEIYDRLTQDERLGFASYVWVDQSFFGFASTLLAPKAMRFISFVNDLLHSIGEDFYDFRTKALLYEMSVEEALKLPFVGRTVVEIDIHNQFFKDVWATIKGTPQEAQDIGSFEITFKPKRNKDIREATKLISQSVGNKGVEKFMIKAREEAHDNLCDLYLVGQGAISDIIAGRQELDVSEGMKKNIVKNKALKTELTNFRNDEAFKKESIAAILRFGQPDAWTDLVRNMQAAE